MRLMWWVCGRRRLLWRGVLGLRRWRLRGADLGFGVLRGRVRGVVAAAALFVCGCQVLVGVGGFCQLEFFLGFGGFLGGVGGAGGWGGEVVGGVVVEPFEDDGAFGEGQGVALVEDVVDADGDVGGQGG